MARVQNLPDRTGNATKQLGLDANEKLEWQDSGGTTAITSDAVIADNTLVRGDGGARKVQDSGITIDDNDNMSGINSAQFDLTNTDHPAEGQINWNSDDGTLQIGMPGGNVALQIGQETILKAKATGSNIDNGDAVYISGATGTVIEATLANNDTFETGCKTIAIATEDITQNQQGYFTTFGIVRDVDTNSWTEGDILYLDSTDGKLTNVMPTAPNCVVKIGYVTRQNATEGEIFVNITSDKSQTVRDITKEPTGFTSPEDVVITGDSTTRTVTLTGTVNAYYMGVPVSTITSGYTSPEHDNTTTTAFFLWYNGTDVEWEDISTLDETFFQNLLIAFAFYDGTQWVYVRECHGLMPWESHRELHETLGTYRRSGGSIGDITLESTTVADRRPSVSAALIYDEDLPTTNPTLTAGGTYTNFTLSGAGATATFDTTATDIVPLSTNQPYWNEFTGGAWQQTLLTNNDYMSIWLVALPMGADTNSQNLRYLWVQGQSDSPNLADEQAKTPNDISLGTLTDLTPELVFIGRVIIVYTAGNWEIVETESIDGTRYSQTSSPQGNFLSSVTTDDTLTGLGTASSPLGVQSTLPLGEASTTVGALQLYNATNANTVTIQSGVTTTSYTMTLPTAVAAGAGYVLTDAAGDGVLSWAAASGGLTWGDSITDTSGTGVTVTQTSTSSNVANIYSNVNNSNGTGSGSGLKVNVVQNAGAGRNNGLSIKNSSTEVDIATQLISNKLPWYAGGGIAITQDGVGGSAIIVGGVSNVNSATNGLVNYTLSNTQSGATVMQKIDLGTSAQAHTGLLINQFNASTTSKGVQVDLGTTGTGIGLQVVSSGGTGSGSGIISVDSNNVLSGSNIMLYLDETASGTLTAKSAAKYGQYINMRRTHTAATALTDFAYSGIRVRRWQTMNNAGGSFTCSGSVADFENAATQTAGTLTDTVVCLNLTQSNSSTGGHIKMNAYSGTPLVDGTFYFDGSDLKARIGGTTYTFTKS